MVGCRDASRLVFACIVSRCVLSDSRLGALLYSFQVSDNNYECVVAGSQSWQGLYRLGKLCRMGCAQRLAILLDAPFFVHFGCSEVFLTVLTIE